MAGIAEITAECFALTDMDNRGLSKRQWNIIFLLCFALGLVFLLWKARYGCLTTDESLYLTIPYRFTQGDRLLVDEWNSSQLSGILTYPIMRLYLIITRGSTEGIALAFRYIYVALQSITALYMYSRLRKISAAGALFGAMSFLLYAPINVMALSYNTMGIMLLLLACVTAATAERISPLCGLFIGLAFAGSVLCCPALAAVYAAYTLVVAAGCVRHRETGADGGAFSPKSWLWFTLGCAVLLAVFAASVLADSSLEQVSASIKLILADPEHETISLLSRFKNFAYALYLASPIAPAVFALCAALTAALLFDRGRKKRRAIYALAALCLTCVYAYPHFTAQRVVNYIVFPVNILGFFAYMLCERRNRAMFSLLYLPGLLYALCISMVSNQGYINIASVTVVSLAASGCFIAQLASELRVEHTGALSKALPALFAALLLAQTGVLIYERAIKTYADLDVPSLAVMEEYGPGRGLVTCQAKAQEYHLSLEDTAQIRARTSGKVMYLGEMPWLYLADAKRSASFSSWTPYFDIQALALRMGEYWQLDPNRAPQYAFVSNLFGDTDSLKVAESLRLMEMIPDAALTKTASGYVIMPDK